MVTGNGSVITVLYCLGSIYFVLVMLFGLHAAIAASRAPAYDTIARHVAIDDKASSMVAHRSLTTLMGFG